jgi:hypothetical protein
MGSNHELGTNEVNFDKFIKICVTVRQMTDAFMQRDTDRVTMMIQIFILRRTDGFKFPMMMYVLSHALMF